MAQTSKKTHYVFNRYVRTPQPGSIAVEEDPSQSGLDNVEQTSHGLHAQHLEVVRETRDTPKISEKPDEASSFSRPVSATGKKSGTATTKTEQWSQKHSSNSSRLKSGRAKTAISRVDGSLQSSKTRKLRSVEIGAESEAGKELESDDRRLNLKERILQYSEEGESEGSGGEFDSEQDWDEFSGAHLPPRGSTRERRAELEKEPERELSFIPKFITAAEAVLPGTDSDYDTDLELEDTYTKLEKGMENIYEGTGKTMYEATCKTEGVVPISYIMQRMTERCVAMRHHYMNSREAVCLANGLKYNTMAEELDLVDNGIDLVGGRAFAEMAVKNKFILRLNLAQNKLGNEGVYPFYRALQRHDNLQALILRNNGLTRTGLKEFCRALKLNNGLQVLDVSENLLESQSAILILEALMQNLCLFDLNLAWNRIQGDKTWRLFAKVLKTNNTLEILNLSKNGTGDRLFALTFKQWKKQGGIKMLDVSENRLTMLAVKKLSLALTKNQTLEYLRLGGNQIGDDGIVWLLKKVLNKNMTIKVLSIENIRMSREMTQTIAELQNDNDRFIIIYGTGHDISVYVSDIIEKLVKYMQATEIGPLDLYFQKPSKAIPAASINKVELDELENLEPESVIYRLKLLNINFNDDQISKLMTYLGVTLTEGQLVTLTRPTTAESEDEPNDEIFSLNAWEPKMHRWLEKQFKLLTAMDIADFCWNFHRYVLFMKAKMIPTREQQNDLLDCKVLKLITLKEITQKL